MKISLRFPLVFAIASAGVLAALNLFLYYLSASYREQGFFSRLEERVEITEQLYLEEDRLDPQVYEDIKEKFLHTLPEETEEVFLMEPGLRAQLVERFPPGFVDQLLNKQPATFEQGDRQGMGKFYHHEEGDYVVVVTAVDQYGIEALKNLKQNQLLAAVVGLVLLTIIVILETRQFLQPLANKIAKASSISASNLHLRLNVVNPHNELGELALAFNQMLDRLEDAFEMQRNFISNASHEIRNPLTAIMGEAEVTLEKRRSPEAYEQALRTIEKEATRLENLVSNLLELAKTGTAATALAQSTVRVDELVMEVVMERSTRRDRPTIQLDTSSFPEEAAHLEVMGHEGLLGAAFANLLDNACKFSDNKQVTVRIAREHAMLVVQVRDQGIGIPQEALRYIAEPLYRAENAREFQGFGIGLALTQRIIELHGGSLHIESREGQGTVVSVSLPYKF